MLLKDTLGHFQRIVSCYLKALLGVCKKFIHLEGFQNLALDPIFPIIQIKLGKGSRLYKPMSSAEGKEKSFFLV
jgi:hypothetical protein